MKNKVSARDLHIQRGVWFEAMLPVDGESEKADVELLGFRFVENSEDGDHAVEDDRHTGVGMVMEAGDALGKSLSRDGENAGLSAALRMTMFAWSRDNRET
jgi:hypothetical protein